MNPEKSVTMREYQLVSGECWARIQPQIEGMLNAGYSILTWFPSAKGHVNVLWKPSEKKKKGVKWACVALPASDSVDATSLLSVGYELLATLYHPGYVGLAVTVWARAKEEEAT